MKLLFLIALFLLISISSVSAQAESWMPVGEGLPGMVYRATVGNGNLYVLHTVPYDSTFRYVISKWDENSWTRVTELGKDRNVSSLIVYKEELYICGSFETIDGRPGMKGIARWDGSSWQSVGGGIDRNDSLAEAVYEAEGISDMMEYKGDLYCTGIFLSIGGTKAAYIARWDGTRWHALGTGLPWMESPLAIYRGDLYAGGGFKRVGLAYGITRWDGNEWHHIGEMRPLVYEMIVYNDKVYCTTPDRTMRWNGSIWENVPTPFRIRAWTVFNDRLYAAVDDQDDPNNVARFDGTQWEILPGFNALVFCMLTYKGQLYAGGNFTQSNGNPVGHIARLCDASNCGTISGNIFHDSNGNCIIDNGERSLSRTIVEMTPGPYYATPKSDGSYAQHVPPGTYDVKLIPREHWNQICPAPPAGYNVTLGVTDNAKEKNFGLRPDANIRDVRVSVVSGRARPGMDLTYAITYENVGTLPVDGTVRFQYDPSLAFVSSTPDRTRHAGEIVEWDFTNLAVDESRTITVMMHVPQSTAIGTKLCGSVEVDLDQLDLRIHQRDTFCIEVRGSYDPNDISVAPFGIEENGEITPEDSILTYTVRFQNTGNDTAFKVVVVDTLSSHLDVATITPGAASHPFSLAIAGKGIATWTFENILLPDSNASEPNSHGFFKYTIRQRRDLPPGTQIPNRVDIYFDYNAPVATNTVVSIIGATSSVPAPVDAMDVTVYPNPAKETIHLRGMIADDARIELRDLLGNRIDAAIERTGEGVMIDLRGMSSGIYFVAIATEQGTALQHITIAR